MTSRAAALLVALAALPAPGLAQGQPGAGTGPQPRALEGVGLTERLGERVPLDATFTDSTGRRVTLGEYLGKGRPVVLTLVYYDCPMLCGLLLTGLVNGMKAVDLEPGRDYSLVTVSFNPRETPALAAEKRGHFLQALGRGDLPQSDWPFLVGDEPRIHALTDAVGLSYRWDEGSRSYAHVAAAYVLTPDGRISRYLYGVQFPGRDLKLALVEAGGGRVGSTFERLLLTCYRYDPASRRYALFVNGYFKVGGLLLLAGVAALLTGLVRRDLRRSAAR